MPARLVANANDGVLAAVARHRAGDVVVGEHPGRRGADRGVRRERPVDRRAQAGGVPRAGHEVEVERGVQLVRAQVLARSARCPAARSRRRGRACPGTSRRPRASCGRRRGARRGRCWGARRGRGRSGPRAASGSLTSRAAESIRTPATPRSNQNRRIVLVLGADVGVVPVEVGLLRREQVQVPLAGRAVGVRRAGPGRARRSRRPSAFGISSPFGPRPGRNQNRSRSGDPGPAASAAWNHACWSETWLGTMSTMVRIPSARASAISGSASARVPNAGSIAR